MKKKIALITGVTGQDGSYLAEILLKKNYKVFGARRRSSTAQASHRIDHIYNNPKLKKKFQLVYLDLTDSSNINNILQQTKPDEIYNLGAQSHVGVSFNMPEYTANVNALGTLRILESIRSIKYLKKTKFYQASSSEMYGDTKIKPQNENTIFNPDSPYAASKIFAYHIVKNYRKAYDMFASNGILFNHESSRRGEFFVTRKIVIELIKIKLGISKCLYLGNLNSLRDWGHAQDYAEMQWRILQHNMPDDFVIATGKQISVRQFVIKVARQLGMKIYFTGSGLKEVGYDENNKKIIAVNKDFFRPADVTNLVGDSKKAAKILKWKPKKDIDFLIEEMIKYDYHIIKNQLVK
jgi:GDPmannose 4,6-dehydratase